MLHGDELLRIRLALMDLVVNNPERILIKCGGCNNIYHPTSMQVRKAPGKWTFYMGKRCKVCASGTNKHVNNG